MLRDVIYSVFIFPLLKTATEPSYGVLYTECNTMYTEVLSLYMSCFISSEWQVSKIQSLQPAYVSFIILQVIDLQPILQPALYNKFKFSVVATKVWQ